MAEAEEAAALPFTPTWIVAAVCSIIVVISLAAERGLHHLGKVRSLLADLDRARSSISC
jgi:mlo protein